MSPDLDDVLERIRVQVADGLADITTSYVHTGLLAWDDVCGTLAVGHERVYRSHDFPTETTVHDKSWRGEIVVAGTIGLVRCVPTLSERGEPPTAAALGAASAAILADAARAWESIAGLAGPEGNVWRVAGLSQQVVGPEGGAVMLVWRFLLGIDQDSWCPT